MNKKHESAWGTYGEFAWECTTKITYPDLIPVGYSSSSAIFAYSASAGAGSAVESATTNKKYSVDSKKLHYL